MVKGDRKKEEDEYFALVLSDASENTTLDYDRGWGLINNDDGELSRRVRRRR